MTYVNDVNKIEMYIHEDWTLRGTPTKYAHLCCCKQQQNIIDPRDHHSTCKLCNLKTCTSFHNDISSHSLESNSDIATLQFIDILVITM